MNKNISERVDSLIQKSFSICNCPLTLIKEFKSFCFEESKGDYSMGLKFLLERNKAKIREESMILQLEELSAKVNGIESKPEEVVEVKKVAKTFGKKEEKVKEDE